MIVLRCIRITNLYFMLFTVRLRTLALRETKFSHCQHPTDSSARSQFGGRSNIACAVGTFSGDLIMKFSYRRGQCMINHDAKFCKTSQCYNVMTSYTGSKPFYCAKVMKKCHVVNLDLLSDTFPGARLLNSKTGCAYKFASTARYRFPPWGKDRKKWCDKECAYQVKPGIKNPDVWCGYYKRLDSCPVAQFVRRANRREKQENCPPHVGYYVDIIRHRDADC